MPCHRVVGNDGSLVGYIGGLDHKRLLLALEAPPAAETGRLFRPPLRPGAGSPAPVR